VTDRPARQARSGACLAACGGSDSPANSDGGSQPVDASGTGAGAGDVINAAALAACPRADLLIQTTDWPSCLAGKRIAGKEPFGDQPCELRIGFNGAFEYRRAGAAVLSVPERSAWRSPTGTYQNTVPSGNEPRLFLASVAPSLLVPEGQSVVTGITLTCAARVDDNVEIVFLDAARARSTYNCRVNAL
jgi:hypothetical protein